MSLTSTQYSHAQIVSVTVFPSWCMTHMQVCMWFGCWLYVWLTQQAHIIIYGSKSHPPHWHSQQYDYCSNGSGFNEKNASDWLEGKYWWVALFCNHFYTFIFSFVSHLLIFSHFFADLLMNFCLIVVFSCFCVFGFWFSH